MHEDTRKLTTASGRPYVENENTLTVGPRGPVLLQDVALHEKMAHFNRERIPERVVHAKGAGAYGTLTVTHDITPYTRAKLFNQLGKQTRVFVRFSTVGGEKGSADTERNLCWVVYTTAADNSLNPNTRYNVPLPLSSTEALLWYQPSCSTNSVAWRWCASS